MNLTVNPFDKHMVIKEEEKHICVRFLKKSFVKSMKSCFCVDSEHYYFSNICLSYL